MEALKWLILSRLLTCQKYIPLNLPKYDLDETESIRRYWRWRGCKKWQDNFFDALDDYGEIQKRRIKLSKTPKRPFEIDDKFNVLKESY